MRKLLHETKKRRKIAKGGPSLCMRQLTGFRVPSLRQMRSGGIPIRSHFPTSACVWGIQTRQSVWLVSTLSLQKQLCRHGKDEKWLASSLWCSAYKLLFSHRTCLVYALSTTFWHP